MTADATLDALGLRGALPCPGWVVLDAARDHRFTGELDTTVDGVDGEFRGHFDRGRIYVAERSTDPTIGVRLVEAGAINVAQLEYGTLRVGEIQHLGRLFDRVPSVNRDSVLVMNQLMTEECVRAMAARQVVDVTATPYRHHPSGMHRWEPHDTAGGPSVSSVAPDMALPAPSPTARPVLADGPLVAEPGEVDPSTLPTDVDSDAAPDDRATEAPDTDPSGRQQDEHDRRNESELFVDDVVEWDEPSLLVTGGAVRSRRSGAAPRDLFSLPTSNDWADDLGPDGVGDDAVDTTASRARLSPVPVRPVEQFELIWPSGETVDLAAAAPVPTDDLDVRASSVRLTSADRPPDFSAPPRGSRDADEASDDAETSATDAAAAAGDGGGDDGDDDGDEDRDDGSPALAVRHAVATIDTGSLEARRRLAAAPAEPLTPPGRLMVNRDHGAWRTSERPATSVFDEQPPSLDVSSNATTPAGAQHRGRAGALRRLIDSLRRD